MKHQFKALLHHYKVEAFKISHSNEQVEELAKEIAQFTEQVLNNSYHYHFHEDPEPSRIETIKMIKNFVLEAIVPPVLDKVMRRMLVLERQHAELVNLVGNILETLSDDQLRFDSDRIESGRADAAG